MWSYARIMPLAPLMALAASAFAATPQQVEGPFHPMNLDNDLTRIRPTDARVPGPYFLIQGAVRDEQGRPISGAEVEIWQADANGKYPHPADPLPIAVDPRFQGHTRLITDSQGRYSFLTIKPGAYPASDDWMRPPHVHVKVRRDGFRSLTTQMYFAGEGLNQDDRILGALSETQRRELVVNFSAGRDADTFVGSFPIVLQRL